MLFAALIATFAGVAVAIVTPNIWPPSSHTQPVSGYLSVCDESLPDSITKQLNNDFNDVNSAFSALIQAFCDPDFAVASPIHFSYCDLAFVTCNVTTTIGASAGSPFYDVIFSGQDPTLK
ncbi:hypothetical protein B7463_g6551, partial [Scytalidium lignicola]